MADPQKPPFDPSQPFEVVDGAKPPFDPNQPFEDAGGNVMSDPPLRGAGGLGGLDQPVSGFEFSELTPEQMRAQQRMFLEVGIPTAVGAVLTPAAGLATRTAAMGAAGGGGSLLSELFDPTPEAADPGMIPAPLERAGTNALLSAAGEPVAAAGLGMARAAVPPLRQFAENQGAKALGFLFSTLQRVGRDEARRVARVGLDEGVMRGMGIASPERLLQRAGAVKERAGQTLGDIRAEVDALGPGTSTDDIIAEIQQLLGGNIVPGEADERMLRGHLGRTVQDVEAYAHQGARNAPVVGPEGDRAFWEMTPREVQSSVMHAPSRPEGVLAGLSIEQQAHLEEVMRAIRAGQQVPEQVLDAYHPQLMGLYPENMNASALGALKKKLADRAYGETGRVPETLMGEFAPRTEAARAVVQGAEDRLVPSLLPARADEFQNAKDVFGAMERLTNEKTGITEAAANRHLGNNQLFGLTSQLSGLAGRTPMEGGLFALLARLAYTRGNQFNAVNADRLAEGLSRLSPRAMSVLGQLLTQSAGRAQGLGMAPPEEEIAR